VNLLLPLPHLLHLPLLLALSTSSAVSAERRETSVTVSILGQKSCSVNKKRSPKSIGLLFPYYKRLVPTYLGFQYVLFISAIVTPVDDPAWMNFPFPM
jgi:hypothetical protein